MRLWALIFLLGQNLNAADLKVAAAADLKFALDEIIQQYRAQHPADKITAIYGASGKFVTQIQEGAPFDLFFSADTAKVQELVKVQKTEGPVFGYAHGHLVLWVRQESKLKLDARMNCLGDESVRKIAVANPQTAPYGMAAEAALLKAGLYDKLKAKFVTGENISQTAQFVESSAANIAIIAKSLALSPVLKKEGRYIDVDPSLYEPLAQSGVVLKGPNVAAARQFKEFFLSGAGQARLAAYGLTP